MIESGKHEIVSTLLNTIYLLGDATGHCSPKCVCNARLSAHSFYDGRSGNYESCSPYGKQDTCKTAGSDEPQNAVSCFPHVSSLCCTTSIGCSLRRLCASECSATQTRRIQAVLGPASCLLPHDSWLCRKSFRILLRFTTRAQTGCGFSAYESLGWKWLRRQCYIFDTWFCLCECPNDFEGTFCWKMT